ncbi:hypothetical protein LguiA_030607 [Lonicera macranthoides]
MRSMLFFNAGICTRPLHHAVRSLVDGFKMLRVLVIEKLSHPDVMLTDVIGSAKLLVDCAALSKALGAELGLSKTDSTSPLQPILLSNPWSALVFFTFVVDF